MAIQSQYSERTCATSLTCSSGSLSIMTPSSNSIGQASLPGCKITAVPDSSLIPTSKLVLVLSDELKNNIATDLF